MLVSTRLLFPNFAFTWLSIENKESILPTDIFQNLTQDIIKELKLEKGVESSMSVFLLEFEGKKALFDAGFFKDGSKGLLDRFSELRISPDDIDYIFITHFHWDHIAGLIDPNDNIVFKNAKVYVSKEEYDGWINKMPEDKNQIQKKITKIYEKQIIQFDFNDKLPLGIIPIKSFGHTPGHTCYRKDDILIVGDLIISEDIHFKYTDISTKFDNNKQESIESRKKILKYAEENKLLVAGMHLKLDNYSMYREYYKNK